LPAKMKPDTPHARRVFIAARKRQPLPEV